MYLKGIKLVTFDATNTLLKFRTPPWQVYADVARNYGFKGTGHNIKKNLLNSYNVMWEEHPNFGKNSITWYEWWREVVKKTFEFQLPDNANIDFIAKNLIEDFKTTKCWCKANGCDELISLLQKLGIRIGVISNFDPRLHAILGSVDILNKFEFVLTSYETGFCKPDIRMFEFAQAKCGVLDPSDCLHIGDDNHKDFEGARAAGWHSILIKDCVPDQYDKWTFKHLQDVYEAFLNEKLKI